MSAGDQDASCVAVTARALAMLRLLGEQPLPPELLWTALGISRASLFRLRHYAEDALGVRITAGREWAVTEWGAIAPPPAPARRTPAS